MLTVVLLLSVFPLAAQRPGPWVSIQQCYRVLYPDSVQRTLHLHLPEFLLFEPAPDSGVVRGGIITDRPTNFWLSFLTHGTWRADDPGFTVRFGTGFRSAVYRLRVASSNSFRGEMVLTPDAVSSPQSLPVQLTAVLCGEGRFQGEAAER